MPKFRKKPAATYESVEVDSATEKWRVALGRQMDQTAFLVKERERLEAQIDAARKEEREACAKIADELFHYKKDWGVCEYYEDVSFAIRNRSAAHN